ncbi:MAG: hypothetical protein QXG39_00535 [Candidatus Aenigmatarchaeota archaeon]
MKNEVREVRKYVVKISQHEDLLKKYSPEKYSEFVKIAKKYSNHHFYEKEKWQVKRDLQMIISILNQLQELGSYDE